MGPRLTPLVEEAKRLGIPDAAYRNADGTFDRERIWEAVKEERDRRAIAWRWRIGIAVMIILAAATIWAQLKK